MMAPMNLGTAAAALLLLLLSACAATDGDRPPVDGDEPSSDPGPPSGDSFTLPSTGRRATGPVSQGRSWVVGVLTFDDIEGGCWYLQTADGTRFEIIYPAEWVLDRPAAVLRGPGGELARAGATIRVDGRIATGRSSICQVGPMYEAATVEVTEG